MSILELLAESGAAGVTEISHELGVHKSTVFRLLTTLEARGLVEQHTERGKYRVGHTAVQIARGAAKMRDLAEIGRPVCQDLAATVGETVSLALHDHGQVITVVQAVGQAAVTSMDWVGKGQPLHATAAGKVFLAHLPPADLDTELNQGLARHTAATITDPVELRGQLSQIAGSGQATVYEEYEAGLVAVAAPVRALGRQVVAALVISGPVFRVNPDSIPGLVPHLESAAAQISWRFGSIKPG